MDTNAPNIKDFGRLLLSLFLIFSIFALTATVAAADRTVKVGIYENQPKIFTDDRGNASGFWPDVITYIATQEGWNLQYIPGTWEENLRRLGNNEIDLMPDVAYSDERSNIYAFSHEKVYTSWSKVYTQKGAGIQSIVDLKGKNIAVLKDSVNVEGPDGIKNLVKLFDVSCTFTEVSSYMQVLELVQTGKADAGVTSKDFGNQHEANFNIVGTPILFQPASLYFALPRTSPSTPYYIERIDYHVRTLKGDRNSIYYRSQEKWFGAIPQQNPVIPLWIIWTLAGIGALVLLLASGSFILRKQVSSRTKALTDEIATRSRAEEALRTNERRLANIYDTVSDVIFLIAVEPDEVYRFSSVNPAFGRVTGLPAEAVIGKTINEIIPEPSFSMVRENYRKAIFNKSMVRWEETSEYPSGRLTGEVTIAPIYDDNGKCTHLVGSVHDITERKQMEEHLEYDHAILNGIIESPLSPIFSVDSNYCYTSFNSSHSKLMKELHGVDIEIGKCLLDYLSETEREHSKRNIDRALRGETIVIDTSTLRENNPAYFEVTHNPITNSDGKITGVAMFASDITIRKQAGEKIRQSYVKLERTMETTVEAIAAIAEIRDPYTAGHQKRVTDLACKIAEEMAISPEKIGEIRIAGTLHDVGKMCIPAEILAKPGKLNEMEFYLIKSHPQIGYDIVHKIDFSPAVSLMILQHHERLNGSGYPEGLRETDILLGAKILAVADVVEAMASHRPYRASLGIDKALEEIAAKKGVLYDNEVVDTCIHLFRQKGFNFP